MYDKDIKIVVFWRIQRVEKVINLEKYVSLHAEQGSRNRAEFRIWQFVGVRWYGRIGKGGKRKAAQVLNLSGFIPL